MASTRRERQRPRSPGSPEYGKDSSRSPSVSSRSPPRARSEGSRSGSDADADTDTGIAHVHRGRVVSEGFDGSPMAKLGDTKGGVPGRRNRATAARRGRFSPGRGRLASGDSVASGRPRGPSKPLVVQSMVLGHSKPSAAPAFTARVARGRIATDRRVPAGARPRHAGRRAASSGSRTRRRLLSATVTRVDLPPGGNQPSEDNCYAYCLAGQVDVAKLEAAWMESLRRRTAAAAQPASPTSGQRSSRQNARNAAAVAAAPAPRIGPAVVIHSETSMFSSLRRRSWESVCCAKQRVAHWLGIAGPVPERRVESNPISHSPSGIRRRHYIAGAANAAAAAAPPVVPVGGRRGSSVSRVAPLPANFLLVPLNNDLKLLKIGHKDCFVFANGCLVCWGLTTDEAASVKDALKPFFVDPLPQQLVDEDSIDIVQREGNKQLACLSCRDPPTFERVAMAYALAQSVRLGSLELRIDAWIMKTRGIPIQMANAGHVEFSSAQVTKMIGELFSLKHEVNLETDILDTPEFFWEYCDHEPLYKDCRAHLDVDQRVSVLNQRFEVLHDLFEVLETELNERHATRLEWVVIFLCFMEALVMALRLYARVFGPGSGVVPGSEEETTTEKMRVVPLLDLLSWSMRVLLWRPLQCITGSENPPPWYALMG